MPAGIAITNTDYTPCQVRRIARKCKDATHSRRLFAVAGALSRTVIAEHAGVALQTLRDWILRYNEEGPSGLQTRQGQGRPSLLDGEQILFVRGCFEIGPPSGVSAWTLSWLREAIKDVFKITLSLETIRQAIRRLGFRKLSPRPFHPKVDIRLQEEFRRDFHRIAKDHLPPGMDGNRVDVWF